MEDHGHRARLRFIIVLLSLAAFASAASMRVTDAMLPRLSAQFHVGLAQAASVSGVSPTDLQNLVIEIEKRRRLAGTT